MGMYSEIRTNAVLSKDTPDDVIDRLYFMIEGGCAEEDWYDPRTEARKALRHELFLCSRWDCLFRMGSTYFDAQPEAHLEQQSDGTWRLTSVANLKNYDGEIRKFADWIRPFCLPQAEPIVTEEYEEYRGVLVRYYQDGRIEKDPISPDLLPW